MKLLYLDCAMGVAGDMLAGALIGLVSDPEAALASLNALGVPHCRYELERLDKCGIAATHLSVKIHGEEESNSHHRHHHAHRSLSDILAVVESLSLPAAAKKNAVEIYSSIALAEAEAHGVETPEVHFHEVGALDAIADVAAACLLIDSLKVDEIVASAVNVGGGTVVCAHGEMPVPAPATAILLKGALSYSDGSSELCTPTGAALLKHFVSRFVAQPPMRVEAIGCGAGRRDLERPNILRAFLGEAPSANAGQSVCELVFTVDDMTGEELAFASKRIFAAGAKDVSFSPVFMKKNRPGYEAVVLCSVDSRDAAVKAVFENTSTIGIRERLCRRYLLDRKSRVAVLPSGEKVRIKTVEGFGVERSKLEADDVSAYAEKLGISFKQANNALEGKI